MHFRGIGPWTATSSKSTGQNLVRYSASEVLAEWCFRTASLTSLRAGNYEMTVDAGKSAMDGGQVGSRLPVGSVWHALLAQKQKRTYLCSAMLSTCEPGEILQRIGGRLLLHSTDQQL